MKCKVIMVVALAGLVGPVFGIEQLAEAKVRVVVIDEETGKPMADVPVVGSFEQRVRFWERPNKLPEPVVKCVKSRDDGRCALKGPVEFGQVRLEVKNPPSGYYATDGGVVKFFKMEYRLGVLQPESLVATVALQRVAHPVPLFVRMERGASEKAFLAGETSVQYDLVKGAYLPPLGDGEIADVRFEAVDKTSPRSIAAHRGRGIVFEPVVAKFVGSGNGVVEMEATPGAAVKIRTAPEEGYVPSLDCLGGGERLNRMGDDLPPRIYGFRIRTQRDAEGKIIGGFYGKFYGDFEEQNYVSRHDDPLVALKFLYYLNPNPLDRNLEYDGTNLNKRTRDMPSLGPAR